MPNPTPLSPYLRVGALMRELMDQGVNPETLAACLSVQAGNMRAIADKQAEAARHAQQMRA